LDDFTDAPFGICGFGDAVDFKRKGFGSYALPEAFVRELLSPD
jgi:hypothetical protein